MRFRAISREDLPTLFTREMGLLIRQAREEKGISQGQLATITEKRRPSVSLIEQGKMVPDLLTLLDFSAVLDKPLSYFLPEPVRQQHMPEKLTMDEQELVMAFRRLGDERVQKLMIRQLSAVGDGLDSDRN